MTLEFFVKLGLFLTLTPLMFCAFAVLAFMFKETTWDVPFKWLCLASVVFYIADIYLNWGKP